MRPFVSDLDIFCIAEDATIRDAITAINTNTHGIVLVTDAERRLINTVTDGDIRRAMLANVNLDSPIDVILERRRQSPFPVPLTAPVETSNATLLQMMNENAILHVPLLDDEGRVADVALLRTLADDDQGLRAVVMAGGFGTRLRPLTADMPKPMLPIGGKPLLHRTIDNLRTAGIKKVNITTHFQAEKISDHFGSGDDLGVELNYVKEVEPLGTAGSLGLIEQSDDTLLVINGDILTTVDFRLMLDYHRANKADLTVGVRQYDVKVPYGIIECDGPEVREIREKPELVFFVNAGIYLVEPSARAQVTPNTRLDMTDLIEALLAKNMRVISFPISEYWLDIGQHADYEKAQKDIAGDGKPGDAAD